MEVKKFKAIIDEKGRITIPVDVLEEMELFVGDSLLIDYNKPTEIIEKCMLIETKNAEENMESYLCIPKEVLEECGIVADDCTIHIMCFDREVTITNESKMLSELPDVILKLCYSFGISNEDIAIALAEECCANG